MFKNKVFNTIICVVVSFMVCNVVFAYDSQTTHPNLTDITVELYNLQGKNKILQSEKYWVKKGSMNEDSGTRSINHFYDPVYNRSWTMGGIESLIPEVISKTWVNDQARQASYDISFLASLKIMTRSYLESETNQTYNRAIYEYLKGNKKEAFYALGHVLHLLQDLTSVPHTRADTHVGKNDESSYEVLSSYKTVDDFKKLYNNFKNNSITKRSSIDDYFYNVALYTNNNFYSEDTIMSFEYTKPEIFQSSAVDFINGQDKYYVLGWDSDIQNVYKLLRKGYNDWKFMNVMNGHTINDPLVFEDYWSRLSKKATLEGAGLIDLFFSDVEKKKNDPQFLAMMEEKHGVSFFINLFSDIKQGITYVASLFNQHPDDIIIQPPNTTTTTIGQKSSTTMKSILTTTTIKPATTKMVAITKTTKITTTTKKTTTTTKKSTTTTKKVTTTTTRVSSSGGGSVVTSKCDFTLDGIDILNQNKKVVFNEIAWMGTINNYSDEWIELKNISSEKVDISLWEIINSNKSIKTVIPSGTILNPQEIYLLERTDDNTVLHVKADLIFVGAIRNEDEELRLLDKNCLIVDIAKANSEWLAGNSESKRTMERNTDFSWYTSSANCINGVCGTPKAENSIYQAEFNTVATTSTTTTSTTSTTLPESTTTTTIPSEEPEEMGELKKIIFSEVKISGENADDEFIELYNPLDEDIDLTDWSIKQKTTDENNLVSDEFLLNKIIPSKGYFLIINKQEGKYKGNVSQDTTFNSDSYALVDNQVLILYDNFSREIDRIGWGNERISNADCENTCLSNIENNKSFERKANENSSNDTMENGIDKLAGNSYDLDNNSNDFIIRNNSDPQNSQSLIEPREEEQTNNWGDGFVLNNFNFYYPNVKKDKVLIEFDVEKYPFWNIKDDGDDKWRSMVFYLNSADNKESNLTRERNNNDVGYAGWQVDNNSTLVLLLKYKTCKSGNNTKYGNSFDSSLVLPHTIGMEGGEFVCSDTAVGDYYGVPNSIAYNFNNSNHIELEVIGTLGPNYERNYNTKDLFKEGDYITIGFYKGKNDYNESFLDSTELIFEDNTKYFFNTNNFKTIEAPKNFTAVYDQENFKYDFTWDKIDDEEGVKYTVCMGDTADNVGDIHHHSIGITWDGNKWTKSILLEDLPYSSGKVFFGVKAVNEEYELTSASSNVIEENVYEMPKRIDKYISNVNWTIKNDRMVVEFDLDRVGKYNVANYYRQNVLTAWDFRSDVEINTYANPAVEHPNGTIGDYSCNGFKNNGRLQMDGERLSGHKEFIIKFLSHPLYKDKDLFNPDGLTLDDLNKLVKSETNPDGILNDLSEMFLVLNYGLRYEPYCGYWLSDSNFNSFTNDTNGMPNQIKYNFNLP